MAEHPAGWYDDEADATWLRYWDGRSWTPHTARKAGAPSPAAAGAPPLAPGLVTALIPAPAGTFAATADGADELAQPLMQTMRLVPEHTTVPTVHGSAVASASPFVTRPVHSGDRLPRGRVALIVVAALVAGSLVVTLASSVAMLLLF
ncbi:DUF2510 domain-containing protein [Agromyces lapidis]|uniref:DUF2510 domain-containing protein n=1 Tax=Agromyces lapidis TaxID=279574 RepID=A0ABV5SPF5_9MICO|nr:DUF2510 domain-containing protein [Agromyces lapidis]